MLRTTLIATIFSLTASAASASPERTQQLSIDRYHVKQRVVRRRSPEGTAVRFSVADTEIEKGAVLLFEIKGVSGETETARWTCLAFESTSECVDGSIRVPYQPDDDRLVLEVSVHSETESWVRNARRSKDKSLLAAYPHHR